MRSEDPFVGILRELGVRSSKALVGAGDTSLADIAKEVSKPITSPQNDFFSHLIAAHASQLADERARTAAAIQEASHNKSLFGWIAAGVLGIVAAYLFARRR